MKYRIVIVRNATAELTLELEGDNLTELKDIALNLAANHEFLDSDYEYEIQSIVPIIDKFHRKNIT